MERIGRPEDDFRERLTREDITEICARHSIPDPSKIEPERRGNEKVIYHLDDAFALQFLAFKEDEEDYRLLEAEPAFPTPRVIAWCERDSSLGASYLITEKCPGKRLDLLWHEVDEVERLKLLRGLGEGMASYHTADGSALLAAADHLELSSRVSDHRTDPLHALNQRKEQVAGEFDRACLILESLEFDTKSLQPKVKRHLARQPDEPLFSPGLASEEPWEEHFIMDRTHDGFRLTGCIDFGPIEICDGVLEITILYASIMSLDRRYFEAFREGYETSRTFPDQCWERLRLLATDYHAWALCSLTRDTEIVDSSVIWRGQTLPDWKRHWTAAHYERLCSMLGIGPTMTEARFRAQIGPW